MAARFQYNPGVEAAIAAQLSPLLLERAEQGADAVRAEAQMTGTRNTVTADGGAGVASFSTDWPFAHLGEWGSVNNAPDGAFRQAAESLGRFEEI